MSSAADALMGIFGFKRVRGKIMKDAKRYDAVHLRYEDSNIRYGEGCEVEVVAGYDYDALKAVSVDLLEALEYCLDCLGDEFALPADCQNNARAAIAKARGEA